MSRKGTPPVRTEPDRYFPCIDGLRATAAVMVVAFHVAGPAGLNAAASTSWVADYTSQLGRLGVAIFFAISGFLLYRPFVVAHIEGRPTPALGPYFRRRFLRIFPAYWLALLGYGLFAMPGIRESITDHLLLRVSLLQGYSRGLTGPYLANTPLGLSGVAVAWTLTIELSFYLVLPAYAWVVRRLAARRSHGSTVEGRVTAELIGLAVLYLTGVVARTLLTEKVFPGPLGGLLAWVDLFAAGMLIAVLRARQKAGGTTPAVIRYLARYPLLGVVLAAELVWLVAMLHVPRGIYEAKGLGIELGRHACYGLVGFLLLTPLVFGNQGKTRYRQALRSLPFRWTGEVSYGLYLWHVLVLYLLTRNLDAGEISFWPTFGATLAITLVIASASYVLLERPVQKLRFGRLIPASARSAPPAEPAPEPSPTAGGPPP